MSNLPRRNRSFTGRGRLLAELRSGLTRGPVAVIAVRGLGGVGKTQLALEYAHRERQTGRYELTWWVRAESPLTLTADFAAMATALGVEVDADLERSVAAVLTALQDRDRWLLVLDNAPDASAVREKLPTGGGHVLITSRDPAWGAFAETVDLSTFTRAEAVTYLNRRTGCNEPQAAEELAALLGDLPLALAQAASYIEENQMSLAAYLKLYQGQEDAARGLFADLHDYSHSVATTWLVHFHQLSAGHPAALQLLRLCAFLDPDDIDLTLLLANRTALAGPLTGQLAAVADPVRRAGVVGALARTSLISRIDGADRVRIHRLVAQVIRNQLPTHPRRRWPWCKQTRSVASRTQWADITVQIVNAVFPEDMAGPATWSLCNALASHAAAAVEYGSGDAAAGALLLKLGRYLLVRGDLATAETGLRRALAIMSRLYGPGHTNVAAALAQLGSLQQRRDQFDHAGESLEQALAIYTRAYGPDHANVAAVLTQCGVLQRQCDQLDQAQNSLERALAIYTRVYGPDHASIAYLLAQLGALQRQLDQFDQAQSSLTSALAMFTRVYSPEHPNLAIVLAELGRLQRQRGQFHHAERSLQRALAISIQVYGPDHPNVATVLTQLGALQRQREQLDQAQHSLQQALAINARVFGPDHASIAYVLTHLGRLQRRLGNLDQAQHSLQRGLAINTRVYGADHANAAYVLTQLGRLQRQKGQFDQAQSDLWRALSIYTRVYGPDHVSIAYVLTQLGSLQRQRGNLDQAQNSLQRALTINSRAYGPDHGSVANVLNELGAVEQQRNQ